MLQVSMLHSFWHFHAEQPGSAANDIAGYLRQLEAEVACGGILLAQY